MVLGFGSQNSRRMNTHIIFTINNLKYDQQSEQFCYADSMLNEFIALFKFNEKIVN